MHKTFLLLSWTTTLLVAWLIAACGANHIPNGQLQSVTISPASASGQAEFTATGFYSDGSKVKPLPALWSDNNPWVGNNILPKINVGANGRISCGSAPAGPYTIEATAPVDPHVPVSQLGPNTPQVHGTAQLTCP